MAPPICSYTSYKHYSQCKEYFVGNRLDPFININTCLSSIPNVNNRDSLLPGQRINVDLVGIAASVSFLFGLGKLREVVVLILLKDKNENSVR